MWSEKLVMFLFMYLFVIQIAGYGLSFEARLPSVMTLILSNTGFCYEIFTPSYGRSALMSLLFIVAETALAMILIFHNYDNKYSTLIACGVLILLQCFSMTARGCGDDPPLPPLPIYESGSGSESESDYFEWDDFPGLVERLAAMSQV
jgi:hypothetical protein